MKFSVKTIKKTICAVVASFVAATAFGALTTSSTVSAEESVGQKYAIDAGDFTLKTDDSVNIDVSYKHGAYLYNKRDAEGNIRLRYKTLSYTQKIASDAFNGLIRGRSADIAYGYVPSDKNHWYVFGDGRVGTTAQSLYSENEYTDVLYDTTAHAFTVKVGDTTPAMARMFDSAEASVADSFSPKRIAWDANNMEGKITASLTDFSVSDEDGFYLGVAMSRTSDSTMEYSLEEKFYGYQNKTVTVKYLGEQREDFGLKVYGEDGKEIDAGVTKTEDGVFTFVMPGCNVKLVSSYKVNPDGVYGTYFNADTEDLYVLGETSYKVVNGNRSEISYTLFSDGMIRIADGELTSSATSTIANIKIGDSVYKKLLTYTVKFVVDGKTAESFTLSSGDYKVTPPASPSKDGYVFDGWKNGKGEAFDQTKTITSSTTYYASFVEAGGHTDPENTKGGCKSSLGLSVTAVPLAATALLLKTKRKGKNNL